jgi:hypothetical protein
VCALDTTQTEVRHACSLTSDPNVQPPVNKVSAKAIQVSVGNLVETDLQSASTSSMWVPQAAV